MCNKMKRTFEANFKKRIIVRANNHAPTLGLVEDLKCTQCKSKNKSKMMLKKEWSHNLLEFFFEADLFIILPIIQMGVHTPSPLREETSC